MATQYLTVPTQEARSPTETKRKQRYPTMKNIDALVDEIIHVGIESALREHAQQQQKMQQRQLPSGNFDPKLNPFSPPPTPYLTPVTSLTHGHLPSIETILEHPYLPQSLYEAFRNGEDRVIDFDKPDQDAKESWEDNMWEKLSSPITTKSFELKPITKISSAATTTPTATSRSIPTVVTPIKPAMDERKDSGIDMTPDEIASLTPTATAAYEDAKPQLDTFSWSKAQDAQDERSWSPSIFSPTSLTSFSCPANSPASPTTPAQFFASINEALMSGNAVVNMSDPKSAFAHFTSTSNMKRRQSMYIPDEVANAISASVAVSQEKGIVTPPSEPEYTLSSSIFDDLVDAEDEDESWDAKMGFSSLCAPGGFQGNAIVIETSSKRDQPRQEMYHYWPPPTTHPNARPLDRITETSRENSRRGSLAI